MKKYLIVLILSFSVSFVFAHQPRLVESDYVRVENPEVSQAFYDELTGQEDIYTIESKEPFSLYVGLLVPDIPVIQTDISARITKMSDPDFEVILDGTQHTWTPYYEPHAGDHYLTGPSFQSKDSDPTRHPQGVEVDGGVYKVHISSSDNRGKYIFVVGYKEEFPLSEIINTVIQVPQIKHYFERSIFSAFSTPTMFFFLLITLGSILLSGFFLFWIFKNFRK